MFRRGVSLFLVPIVLLTQWASAGHCHGCRHAPGHDGAPHIHVHWPGPAQSVAPPQSTENSDRGCCRHHHENDCDIDQDDRDPDAPPPKSEDLPCCPDDSVLVIPTALIHGALTGRDAPHVDDGLGGLVVFAPAGDAAVGLMFLHPGRWRHSSRQLRHPDCPATARNLQLLI